VPMTVPSPFADGAVNPLVAFAMALVGALVGLSCLARAQRTSSRVYARRWLAFSAITLAVVGVWLTHFIAVLGFDMPDSPIRYSVSQTVLSLAVAIVVIGLAIRLVGASRPSVLRVLVAGALIGGGVSAMHYAGVDASQVEGFYTYDGRIVAASVMIAVVGSVIALALTVWGRSYGTVAAGAVVFAVMVVCTHYAGMAALRVHLINGGRIPPGVEAISILIPVTVGGILTLLAMLFAALGMMSDDDVVPAVDGHATGTRLPPIRPAWRIPPQHPAVHAGRFGDGPDASGPGRIDADQPTQIVTVSRLRAPDDRNVPRT
jgi:NO-binding membrane sensor protein with MHYT domain